MPTKPEGFSREAAGKHLLEAWLPGAVRHGLLEGYLCAPSVELQGRDLVGEKGAVVGQAPGQVGGFDAGEGGGEAPGERGGLRPGEVLEARFLFGEGVAQRGADRLVDPALCARSVEDSFGEVAVVDVAGDDRYGGRGVSPVAGREAPDQAGQRDER